MTTESMTSWGRVAKASQRVHEPAFADMLPGLLSQSAPSIAYGLGRSYGDVCLNDGGTVIRMHRLDRVLAADWDNGVVRAEAGASLDALLRLAVPRGWFLPVMPGTKFVTLGGAVANDVHGKNHEDAGTFGCHVRALGVLRSSGEIIETSPHRNPQMFAATIGGLGLTGLILWVELELAPIASAYFDTESTKLDSLDDFFIAASESRDWPYTVAWVDCLASGSSLGRGWFTRGRPASEGALVAHKERRALHVPVDAPARLLNGMTLRAFNQFYASRPGVERPRRMHYDGFLFPLDRIGAWNRLYGRRGFYQHQSVVPLASAPETLRKLLELVSVEGQGSFLVVLKLLGSRPSPGLLSFPMAGATFALDLPNRGASTRKLLGRMTEAVMQAGGRLYPAKDATMSGEAFRAGYPNWRALEALRDPAFMSDFWRRVTRDSP